MDDEEDEDLNLKPGTVVDSSKGAYVVVQLLGEGGFGAVYKVYDQKDQRKEYAMKVEKKLESRRHSKLKMEGTIRFASLACHRNIEMGPKDDCESWFYLLLDLIVPRGLLWKSVPDKNMVKKLKEDMRTTRREVAFQGLLCKEQLMSVMDYLDSLQYQDRVDYEFIYKSLELGAKTAGGNIDLPYDWELGDDPTQTVTCAEQPRQKSTASRSRARAKRKKTGTPGHSSQRKLKGASSSGVNPAEVKSGAKEKSHAGSKENIKEARPQKGGTSERKSEGSKDKGRHGDKGFFSKKSTPKRRAQKKLKSLKDPSSTSRALSIGVRKKNARKPSQKSRGRKPKKEASSSSSSERSGAGKENLRRRWSTRLSKKIVGRRKDESQDSDSSEERAEAEENTNQSINTGDVSL
ncbi:hypothetical protein V3C99_000487 [Haemonchus contortus]